MSTTADPEYDKYVKDPRISCKYGNGNHNKHLDKKLKIETLKKEVKQVATKQDSDSDYSIDDNSDTDSESGSNPDVPKSDETDTEIEKENGKIDCNTKNGNGCESIEEKHCYKTHKEFMKEKFLVDMPEDFFQFWEFCKMLKANKPSEALKDIGLTLVGPFDVLANKFCDIEKSDEEYLVHWRYYHDPPEFQTILKGSDKTGYHIGYFRDSPEELPVFLASNHANKDGILRAMEETFFRHIYLDDLKKTGDPFTKMHIGRIQEAVRKEAGKLHMDMSLKTHKMVSREKEIVTRTFNKIGLVVPYDRKTQLGYRELALGNKELAVAFTKLKNATEEQKPKYLSELQPVFTFANIATDECDFGTSIELGWDIIAHGVDSLDSTAMRHLATNYRLLNKEAFAKIAEAHLKNRRKGVNLSII
ncbi:hypothetical protein NQ317_014451 [Molorchus minor]|uniref:Histone PARylation factor 1 n=1 Tax=Molorchus minor TaxID=1323400 RepID=A0ABQ9J5R7_9CUCU|nr:hypothetical protein NQ317_014451 [Molorchus minor]